MTRRQAGFTLLEALVAMAIVVLVVLSFLGVRTTALVDASEARNWRLAREIAEEKLSELNAGAREVPPESGVRVPLDDKYPGFSYEFDIGESAVGDLEARLASAGTEDDEAGRERLTWQQNRDLYRRAANSGLDYWAYQDKLAQEQLERERQEKAPSETDFEEVAVVVFFPSADLTKTEEDSFVLKAKVSTLALSGMTPDQAQVFAQSHGQTVPPSGSSGSGAAGGGEQTGGK